MDVEISNGSFPEDTSEENKFSAKSNRYLLSGDLIAGKISTILKIDGSMETERRYYHLDHLNSTKVVTDEEGKPGARYIYRAFGDQLRKIGEEDAKYTYGGKELDSSSNLYYFNARYYDATLGRFINVDPAQANTNWYIYCSNNPLSFVDPTGLTEKQLSNDQYNETYNQIDMNWEGNNKIDKDGVRWFDQNVFDGVMDMGTNKDNLACNLTTHMNMLSKEYTTQTGETMGKNELMRAFTAGYENGDFSSSAWLKKTGDNFLNDASKALGLEGSWKIANFTQDKYKFLENEGSKSYPLVYPDNFRREYSYEKILVDNSSGKTHFRNIDTPSISGRKMKGWDTYYGNQNREISGATKNIGTYSIVGVR